uniref:Uncharacterized protein n=1 Tax=Steinernema glaseri TaxID=37863 RepID=A0A1I8A887_9BILA
MPNAAKRVKPLGGKVMTQLACKLRGTTNHSSLTIFATSAIRYESKWIGVTDTDNGIEKRTGRTDWQQRQRNAKPSLKTASLEAKQTFNWRKRRVQRNYPSFSTETKRKTQNGGLTVKQIKSQETNSFLER